MGTLPLLTWRAWQQKTTWLLSKCNYESLCCVTVLHKSFFQFFLFYPFLSGVDPAVEYVSMCLKVKHMDLHHTISLIEVKVTSNTLTVHQLEGFVLQRLRWFGTVAQSKDFWKSLKNLLKKKKRGGNQGWCQISRFNKDHMHLIDDWSDFCK